MPAGQSLLGIWNMALLELGERPLVSTDDQISSATKCRLRWLDVRQATLREFNWNCAKKYAQWAASATPPAFGWDYAYDLPADYIRHFAILDVDGDALDDAEWEIVGAQLFTDEGAPLNVAYYFDLQDPTKMDAGLVQVLAYNLALEIGPGLVRDDQRLARLEAKLERKLAIARLTASQENSTKEWDTDVLLRSRR